MRIFFTKSIIVSAIMSLAFFVACSDDVDDGGPKVVSVTGVTVDQERLNFATGSDTDTLVATVLPADATNKKITWKSSDEAIATVNQSGVVSPLVVGTTTIIVTTEDGNKTDTCIVIITAGVVDVTEVTVNKDVLNLSIGEVANALEATVLPEDATNRDIEWTSDDYGVASVDQFGVVTAIGEGVTTITVTTEDGNKTAPCVVTVTVPVSGVTVDMATLNLAVANPTPVTIVATVLPANASNKNVVWSSSDEAIATVSELGAVTPVGVGETTIIATTEDGEITAPCVVTVVQEIVDISYVSLIPMMLSLKVGLEKETISTILRPAGATHKTLTWTSSEPTIASVDQNGVVTPLSVGIAIITATPGEGVRSDECWVTVSDPILVTSIQFPPIDIALDFFEGGEGRILATPGDPYANLTVLPHEADNKEITWSSGDEAIATVHSKSGFITPLKIGKTRITVTAEDGSGVSAFKEINVKAKEDQGHGDFEDVDGVL